MKSSNYNIKGRKVKAEYFITGFLFCLLFITLLRKPDPNGDGFLASFSLNKGHSNRQRQDGPDDKKARELLFNARGGPAGDHAGRPVLSTQNPHEKESGDRTDVTRSPYILSNPLPIGAGPPTAQGGPAVLTIATLGYGGPETSPDGPPALDWLDELIDKIHQVESGGRKKPPDGDGGNAVGPLQIHRGVVKDVNLFYNTRFDDEDRRDIEKSRTIARLYMTMWMNAYREEICSRIWNGGPRGWEKKSTKKYWQKIKYEK